MDPSRSLSNLQRDRDPLPRFDVPGSTCLPSFPNCTIPVSVSPEGAIAGYYADANATLHSFLRTRDGGFTTFDPPGSRYTFPLSINRRE